MAKMPNYEITVINWNKYNSEMKRGHKSTLISNNFVDDPKFEGLGFPVRWMLLGILLTCGDHTSQCVVISHSRLRQWLAGRVPVSSALDILQQLRIVTYAEIDSFLNRIEKKRIEGGEAQLALVPDGPSSPPINQREICIIEKAEDFAGFLEQKHFDNWAKIYDIPYMKQELVKATAWLLARPEKNRKTRKGLTQFIGNWFNRGWDQYLKRAGGGGGHRSSFTGVADV